ncbi:ECF RNA polymerase sigma factor SigM [Paenibacillus albidus]|uniref:ECF RNA polymerase sigma factor SigM n=1 Tax=Paenibacillus albidus TaxID=2041023 RepID=A0A917C8N6_9BACL|nr:sigma-70 family RNA polymerase sigma factor [Paenibacillus albidus]GGF73928.1 ECF RNA polymerase sigma factor SigM [Paenibacillus albidus]
MKLDTLYQDHVSDLYRYLFSLTNDHYLAEDLVQETFYRAYLYLENNELENVKPWLFKVGYRVFIDHWRKGKRVDLGEPHPKPDEQTPEKTWLEQEGLNRILGLIRTLPPNEAHALLLCDFHQLKLHETADILNLNLNTLKSHLARGRKKMRLLLQKEER